MTWNSLLTLILWISPPIMESLLLLQARRRRLWGISPMFFAYTAFQIVKFVLLFAVRTRPKEYFVAYWIGEIMDTALVVAVLYQLYSNLFSGYNGLRALQDALFRWSAAVCILVAVVVAASINGNDSSRVMTGLLAFELGAAVLKAGLIIFAIVISSALALRWSHYAFAVLVGMGVYNTVELATAAIRLQMGMTAALPYRLIKAAAYNCALLVWIAYFFSKEQQPVPLRSVPENDLASWNEALLQLLTK